MKKYYVNVEVEMADGTLEYDWYSVSAPDDDTAVDKVYEYLERETTYSEWCRIQDIQEEPPVLVINID